MPAGSVPVCVDEDEARARSRQAAPRQRSSYQTLGRLVKSPRCLVCSRKARGRGARSRDRCEIKRRGPIEHVLDGARRRVEFGRAGQAVAFMKVAGHGPARARAGLPVKRLVPRDRQAAVVRRRQGEHVEARRPALAESPDAPPVPALRNQQNVARAPEPPQLTDRLGWRPPRVVVRVGVGNGREVAGRGPGVPDLVEACHAARPYFTKVRGH